MNINKIPLLAPLGRDDKNCKIIFSNYYGLTTHDSSLIYRRGYFLGGA